MKFRELIAYDEDEKREWHLSQRAVTLIVFCVWVAALNLLAVVYIKNSDYIYFWDNATYWDISRRIADGALLPDFLKNVYHSIAVNDYNCVAGLLPAVFIKLFGDSRLVYVLTLVDLYLVPSVIIIYFLAKKLGKAPLLTMSLTILLCPAVIFMALIGFADVGGLPPALLCFYLYFNKDKKDPGVSIWKCIVIGLLLTLLILWRRWYAFFAVSFVTAMLSDCIINRRRLYPAFISAAVVGFILIVCFRDFVTNIILRDYGSLYSGYKMSVLTDLKLIARYFGVFYIFALAAMTVYGAVKKHNLRPIMMWVQIVVCAIMFMCVQTHGQQHLLLYIPSFITLTIYAIRFFDREWMLIAACAMAAVNTANVFVPYNQPQSIQEIKFYSPVPSFSLLPRHMDNTEELHALRRGLDSTVPEGQTLGVLSSSFKLNEDILKNVYASFGMDNSRENYFVSLPQVDIRDTDLSAYGSVNFILTANPLQIHLDENNQRILREALISFNGWTDIATAYEEVYDFAVTIDDMQIKLYRRVRDIPDYEYRAFITRYKATAPQ